MKNKKNGRNKQYSSFEKRCRKKSLHCISSDKPDIPKGNMRYDQYTLFLTLWLLNLLFLLSFSPRKHTSVAFCVILLKFFEEQSTQNHPQYLSGLLGVLFPTTTFLRHATFNIMSGFICIIHV